MTHELERVGIVLIALLAASVLALPLARAQRAIAQLATLVVTPALLALTLWHDSKVATLRHHPARAVAAVLIVVLVVAALAFLIDRRPALLPLLALLALPFRIPLGSVSNGLLIPLYAVIAAGVIVRIAREREPAAPGVLERVLALALVLYALQALYAPSAGLTKAVENAGFFYVPFALLYVLLRETDWTPELQRRAFQLLVALGVLFALVGLGELADHSHLLFNRGLDQDAYFIRINSLFYDPNVYGRYLALTALVACLRWRRGTLLAWQGVVLALLWAGLVISLSESAMVALLGGLAVAWVLSARRPGRATLGLAAALALAVALAFTFARGSIPTSLGGTSGSLANATSGRTSLVSEGAALFADRPLQGFGSGSFATEYAAHISHRPNGFERHEQLPYEAPSTTDSHTSAITVAAEQGLIGLAIYLALLLAGFARVRRDVLFAALFTALVIDTLFYADFLEDPATWVILALAVKCAAAPHTDAPKETACSPT